MSMVAGKHLLGVRTFCVFVCGLHASSIYVDYLDALFYS